MFFYFKKKGGGEALSDYWWKRKQAGVVKSHKKKKKSKKELSRGKGWKKREAWITFVRYLAVTSKTDLQEEVFQQKPAGGAINGPFICERRIILNKLQSTFAE